MGIFIYALGVIQIFASVAIVLSAESVMHEILAALLFGFGVLGMGVGALLREVAKKA